MVERCALAFDIGGSKLVTGIINAKGEILTSRRVFWDGLSQDSIIETVFNIGINVIKEFDGKIDCIGATIPGLADTINGIWVESCFSGVHEVPIVELLQNKFLVQAYIDNDVNLCAFAEKKYGVTKNCNDFIWLTVSNGCGGAIFIDGNLYRGTSSNAGEFGHIIVEDHDGDLCGCGNRGCLEAQASGHGIVRRYHRNGGKKEFTSSRMIADEAKKGDKIALSVFEKEGYYLGKAISAAVNVLNPEMVIVGGGVAQSYELFEKSMNDTIAKHIYKKANPNLIVMKTKVGYYAPLLGAGLMALEKSIK